MLIKVVNPNNRKGKAVMTYPVFCKKCGKTIMVATGKGGNYHICRKCQRS